MEHKTAYGRVFTTWWDTIQFPASFLVMAGTQAGTSTYILTLYSDNKTTQDISLSIEFSIHQKTSINSALTLLTPLHWSVTSYLGTWSHRVCTLSDMYRDMNRLCSNNLGCKERGSKHIHQHLQNLNKMLKFKVLKTNIINIKIGIFQSHFCIFK